MLFDCRWLECSLISGMQEVYLVLSGITLGSISIAAGVLLGAQLVKKTYTAITDPEMIFNIEGDVQDNSWGLPDEAAAYDWDSYDQYVTAAEEEDEEVPEA